MDIFKTCSLLFFLGLSSGLFAQPSDSNSASFAPSKGLWLSGTLGTFFAGDGLSNDRSFSPIGLELGYQKPLSGRLSLTTGLGLQYREQELITASGEPCVFPLGVKVVDFIDSESYEANQLEGFLRFGLTYQRERFSVSAAVLPALRISNQITYRFYRDFSLGNRPDAEIDQTIRSGEAVDLAAIGGGPRVIEYTNRINVQAELALGYLITPRLRLALALRPMLTPYDIGIRNQSFCTDVLCVDFSGESQAIGSLNGVAGLLQISCQL